MKRWIAGAVLAGAALYLWWREHRWVHEFDRQELTP